MARCQGVVNEAPGALPLSVRVLLRTPAAPLHCRFLTGHVTKAAGLGETAEPLAATFCSRDKALALGHLEHVEAHPSRGQVQSESSSEWMMDKFRRHHLFEGGAGAVLSGLWTLRSLTRDKF